MNLNMLVVALYRFYSLIIKSTTGLNLLEKLANNFVCLLGEPSSKAKYNELSGSAKVLWRNEENELVTL